MTVNVTEDQISATFEAVSDGQVERVKKAKDYAFVHFNTREAAERAYEETKDVLVYGKCILTFNSTKSLNVPIHIKSSKRTFLARNARSRNHSFFPSKTLLKFARKSQFFKFKL